MNHKSRLTVVIPLLTDLRGAVTGGAVGWCFHNGTQRTTKNNRPRRSFDLSEQRLMDQLNSEELKVLAGARLVVDEIHGSGESSSKR